MSTIKGWQALLICEVRQSLFESDNLNDLKPIMKVHFLSETFIFPCLHGVQSRAPCGGKHHLCIAAVHQTAQSENATFAEELVLDGIDGVQHSVQVEENHLVV